MRKYFLTSLILLMLVCPNGFSQGTTTNEKCMICHGKKNKFKKEVTGRKIPLYVDQTVLKKSVHGSRSCTDCHIDIVDIPHKQVKKVNCRRCHYSGNTVGAPQGNLYKQYEQSIHGVEVSKGNPKAPVCQDCHGTHDVFKHDNPASKTYRLNIPKTCGRCHIDIYATYKESVHGVAVFKGNLDAPVCSSCHGEHNIKAPNQPGSTVAPLHVTKTCSGCHGAKGVVAKYGIKTDRFTTFEESFHGVAQLMNNKMVANCASCHGYHDIRAANDPKSSVYPANIPKTCGKPQCHPEANANFASGKIHINPKSEKAGVIYYISKFFMILTAMTLAGLFIFIILDLFRRAKRARSKR